MNFFRYCDFFDIKFNFYHEHKLHITLFGGFMGISFIILSIIISIFLSIDDFQKLNPITTRSEVPGGDFRTINLKESNIYIPWRLITYEEKFIDHKGILYPTITLIEGNFNEDIGMNLKYHNLKYKLCNETSMVNITDRYKIDTPLNELFCIEQNDIPFGGSWLSDTLYYLEVNLFLCQDGIKYNASDPRCTKLPDIIKYTNTPWLFEFFYPIVQFQPTNREIPMMVIYKNYYYRISSHTYKLERLYIQENILSDDESLFTNSPKNTSCWGISTIYGDTYFWSEEQDPLVKSNSSCLFSLDIYMDQGYIYYSRSYKKIIDILSNIFPIINILLIIFDKFTLWVKLAFAKQTLVEKLFENTKIYKTKSILYFNIDHNSSKNIMPKNTINMNRRPKYEDNMKLPKERFRNHKLTYINNIYINDNHSVQKEPIKTIFRKPSDNNCGSKDESRFELFNSLNYKKNKKQKEKEKTAIQKRSDNSDEKSNQYEKNNVEYITRKKKGNLFPLFYFFMDIFISKLDKPKTFCCLDKRYLIVYNFMERIFNISSYVLLYKYFNIYKTVFSKELKELNLEKFDKKININNTEQMGNIEQKIFESDSENNAIFSKTIIY